MKITASILRSLGMALSSAVLMNIFIVGINQIFDVPIDKINKPDLPLPKGSLTTNGAIGIVSVAVITSLLLGSFSGSRPLQITLVASMILGIAYSTDLPFLRWKRNAVVAALCILTIRAVAVQLGFYFHMKQCCGPSNWVLTKPLVYATSLIAYFSVVIALFKDIPDVKGDRQVRFLSQWFVDGVLDERTDVFGPNGSKERLLDMYRAPHRDVRFSFGHRIKLKSKADSLLLR